MGTLSMAHGPILHLQLRSFVRKLQRCLAKADFDRWPQTTTLTGALDDKEALRLSPNALTVPKTLLRSQNWPGCWALGVLARQHVDSRSAPCWLRRLRLPLRLDCSRLPMWPPLGCFWPSQLGVCGCWDVVASQWRLPPRICRETGARVMVCDGTVTDLRFQPHPVKRKIIYTTTANEKRSFHDRSFLCGMSERTSKPVKSTKKNTLELSKTGLPQDLLHPPESSTGRPAEKD